MAFNASGVSAQGYYHTLTPYGGQSTTRQLFSVYLAPFSDTSFRRILHTHFTTASASDSHQLIKLSNNKIAICRGSGNTAPLSSATDSAITGGEWIHLLAWCDSGGTPSLWLNGAKQTSSNATALGTGTNNSRLYVGMRSSQDAPYKGDTAELAYWIANTDAELPEPTDAEAMLLYRSGNPWSHRPDALRVVRPFQKVDQPAIYLGTGAGSSVKIGAPTQAASHAPITRSDISFIRAVDVSGISITGNSVNADYAPFSGTVTLTGAITVDGATTNTNYSTPAGTITLTGTISVAGQVSSAVYEVFSGAVDLTGLVDVTGQVVNTDYSVNAGTVILTPPGTIIVVGGVSNADYQVYSGAVTLSGIIDVSGEIVNADYQVYQGTVTLSVVKSADCFTALEGTINPILATTGIIDGAETALSGIITPITALEGQIDPSDIALEGKLCC